MPDFDVVVLGLGGVGSAALYHLAKRGVSVMGLDRFPAGHHRGSSHGETRIIRQAYFEHPDYVPLLKRAYELWADLERQSNRTLFYPVGLLQVGPPDGVVVPGVLRSAHDHGLDVEPLNAAEAMRRFPMFRVAADQVAVFERRAGYLRVEECVKTHLAEAQRLGARANYQATIVNWQPQENGFEVSTSTGRFSASKLLITAGAWATSLAGDIGIPLRVLRKHLHWFQASDRRFHRDNGCPTYLFENADGVFYGFPQVDELGVKVAEHSGGEVAVDPLNDPRDVDSVDRARVLTFMQHHMPGVTASPLHHAVCFYTMSPDSNFLLDWHPQNNQVAFAAGLSGHGFKFTNVLGLVLCEMILDGRTTLPTEFLRLSRFQ